MKQEKENRTNKYHEFTEGDGERCWKCGDKDWMASEYCSESKVNEQNYKKLTRKTRND